MDNACELNIPSIGRNFGHCIVTWEIQNYGRALWKKNFDIKTPEFCIKGPNSRDTNWKLILKTKSNHNRPVEELNANVCFKEKLNSNSVPPELPEIDFKCHLSEDEKKKFDVLCANENKNIHSRLSVKNLMLYLERCSHEGPTRVGVDWKVYYIGIKGEKICLVHDQHIFDRKFKYGFNIGTLYDYERDLEYNSGLTTIMCDIIVTDTDSSKDLNEDISLDLSSLSEDLKWIFDTQQLCDTEIKVNGKIVKAHKAMLSSHTELFNHAGEESSNVFESNMKYNEVLKILEYMYSHDLDDVIGKPSVSVYDAAIHMKLSDLAAHYDPQKVKISTKIDVKKFAFQWVIEDFSKQTGNISSIIHKDEHDDTAWQIHLYPKGIDGKSEYIELSVECIDGIISNEVCIQCSVLTNNENLNIWKNLQNTEDNNTVVRDKKFILRQDVFKLLNNDRLELGFKVRTYSGKASSVNNIQCSPVLYSKKKSIENMTKNMLFLRNSNNYTDVTFNFGVKEIKAHKFILLARSHVLRRIFEESCNRVPPLKISAETFEILLDYMYCATFNVFNINTAIAVYKSAEELLIPRLQEKCSRFLQNSITVVNVMSIFMFTNEHYDKYLKEKAENFIKENKNNFIQSEQRETGAVPKKMDDIVSVACITKSTSIIKYNEVTVVNYDFEMVAKPLNGNVNEAKLNVKGSDNIATMKIVSGETIEGSLEVLHGQEENKSLPETQNSIVVYRDYSSKPVQSEKLNVLLKPNYSNEKEFSDSVKTTENEQLQQDEISFVHIDGKEIKENPSLNKNGIKREESPPTSDINESEQIKQNAHSKEILESMQYCYQRLKEHKKQLDAEKSAKKQLGESAQKFLDEQCVSGLQSTECQSQKCSKADAALRELHGNEQVFPRTEWKEFDIKVEGNESQKGGSKPDAALRELYGSRQTSEKQNGSDLQSNADNETDAALNELQK